MKNMLRYILLLSTCLLMQRASAQQSVDHIYNPKTEGNGYVSNADGILSQTTVNRLNKILADLEQTDSFQVAVVCVNSIGNEVPKDVATTLFNSWGLGRAGYDDGLLILLVKDQRRIEFETGYGTESVLSDARAFEIQQEDMLPYFREGDYDQGILNGVESTARFLSGKKPESRGEAGNYYQDYTQSADDDALYSEIEESQNARLWNTILIILGWHLVGVLLFLICLFVVRFTRDPYGKYRRIRLFQAWVWAIVFPLTHIFIVLLTRRLMNRYRNMVRFSGKTGEIMHKLTEAEEDAYLKSGQIAEELVKSVDYDVWKTENSDDLLVLQYRPLFSAYSSCPKCRYRTWKKDFDRITIPPTYVSPGAGERQYSCTHCKHVSHMRYYIPKLQRSSSTRSGSGWRGSSSGSVGGGSFGGSSGGSWGGGRSGGGGAGSSW